MRFETKEEYLTYRANWKIQYNELSQQIRDLKWMNKEYSRAANAARLSIPSPHPTKHPEYLRRLEFIKKSLSENKRYQDLLKKWNIQPYYVGDLRNKATIMLAELKQAKMDAQEAYLASRNKKEMVTA